MGVFLHSLQKDFPQHKEIDGSRKRSLQTVHTNSSGMVSASESGGGGDIDEERALLKETYVIVSIWLDFCFSIPLYLVWRGTYCPLGTLGQ